MKEATGKNVLSISDLLEAENIRERVYSDEEIQDIRAELEEYLDDHGGLGMIKHPLIMHMGYDPACRETVAMLGRQLELVRWHIKKLIVEGDWSWIMMLHEKPWRVQALLQYEAQMPDEDYWRELGNIWCGIETPGTYLDELPWLFNPQHRGTKKRHLMMTEEERVVLRSLPEELTIYRGCAKGNRRGYSWSLDREQGEWFARRQGLSAQSEAGILLLIGECRKPDVIAHLTRRDEAEIVINPDDVKIIESVAIGKTALRHSSEKARSAMSDKKCSVTAARLLRFEPNPGWFIRRPEGIHGLGHETRVLIWSQVLVSMVRDEDIEVDGDVVGWAAAVHDTQRWNDGIDGGHGARAADWILERPDLIPAPVPLDQIAYVCRWHVPPDERAPKMTPELKVFKDADALDRWRIDDLDPAYLRTNSARQLLDASYALWEATHGFIDATEMFEQIIDVART